MRLHDILDRASGVAATAVRGWAGARVGKLGRRPAEPLLLWEYESCPYCRKVREAISILDLEVLVHPCPRGGTRFRPEIKARYPDARFPLLVDPDDGGRTVVGSDRIVAHLFARYGASRPPRRLRIAGIANATSALASALRFRGGRARPSLAPAAPLELWAFEGSPACRPVREVLSELELRYLLRPIARGSPRRHALRERWGDVAAPFLLDPNADVAIYGTAAVIEYLERTYGRGA